MIQMVEPSCLILNHFLSLHNLIEFRIRFMEDEVTMFSVPH